MRFSCISIMACQKKNDTKVCAKEQKIQRSVDVTFNMTSFYVKKIKVAR